MQKGSERRSGWRWSVILFLIALLIATADQLSKNWIRSNLLVGQSYFEAGLFRVIHVSNTGAAFGLFQGQSFILTIIGLAGIAVFLVYILVIYRGAPFLNNLLNRVALGLVFGGALGNLIDRLRFGQVTDFLDFGFWPVFNIADSAVTVGVILFAFSLLSVARTRKSGLSV